MNMKTFVTYIILQLSLVSLHVTAETVLKEVTGTVPIFEVTTDSTFKKVIDDTFVELFSKEIRNYLCQGSTNYNYWHDYAGVSLDGAQRAVRSCRFFNKSSQRKFTFPQLPWAGNLKKKTFYIILDFDHKFSVQSWTDTENKTFIFIDDETSLLDFKLMLVHEWAVTFDSKNNLDQIAFMGLEGLGPTVDTGYDFDNYDFERSPLFTLWPRTKMKSGYEKMQPWADATNILNDFFKILDIASTQYFSQTMAVMRANNVERSFLGKEMTTVNDHDACVKEFRELYTHFVKAKLPRTLLNPSEDFWVNIVEQRHQDLKKISTQEISSIYQIMLSPDFRIPIDGHPSFCRYMALPRLEGIKNNFFSSGPRPRFTGGTGFVAPPVLKDFELNGDFTEKKILRRDYIRPSNQPQVTDSKVLEQLQKLLDVDKKQGN